MAKLRIKKNNLDLFKKQARQDIRRKARRILPEIIEKAIIDDSILKGKSPVQGGGRFKRYSESYRKAIRNGRLTFGKSVTPVNMKLTGEMIKSFYVRATPLGFKLGFTDIKAVWHDLGLGNLPVRKLLPGIGEKFNRRINRSLQNAIAL